MLGIKLNTHKDLTKDKEIYVYNKPKYIYIPLISGNDTDVICMVKKGDYVFKGDIVVKTKGSYSHPIHSSISGIVVDFTFQNYLSGNKIKCIKIENDYKEKISDSKKTIEIISKYTKEDYISILKECGVIGCGSNSFPTYTKYDTTEKIKTLIVNAVECEPYLTGDYIVLKNNVEEILETIDAIMEINKIDECFIALKNNNHELKEILKKYLGTYMNIKIIEIPNLYPMGWERNLVKYVKKVTYDKLPIEKGIVVNNVQTIYSIYQALKYQKPITEKIVTITGEMLKNPINVEVKIGTKLDEVIEEIGGLKRFRDIIFIAGGPMTGNAIMDNELIVSSDLNCVLIKEFKEQDKSISCFRCGRCVKVCPAKLEPVLIKDYCNNSAKLKILRPLDCIECGLCSYICPSKINVREYVKKAKRNIQGYK